MKEKSPDVIDELFTKIRLKVLKLRDSDPDTAEELKSLLTQMEDCVESLVVDSLKLKSLEIKPKKTTPSGKKRG